MLNKRSSNEFQNQDNAPTFHCSETLNSSSYIYKYVQKNFPNLSNESFQLKYFIDYEYPNIQNSVKIFWIQFLNSFFTTSIKSSSCKKYVPMMNNLTRWL